MSAAIFVREGGVWETISGLPGLKRQEGVDCHSISHLFLPGSTPLLAAVQLLGRVRQEDYKFKNCLGYRVSSSLGGASC